MGLFDRFNRSNSNYIVPDGGDFIIYCEYSTELKNNLNNELIEYFYKKSGRNIVANISDYKNYKRININSKDDSSSILTESWTGFEEEYKSELIDGLKDEMKSNREEIIDILKHCNSVHTIDCKTKENVILVLYFAEYCFKFTKNILVSDTSNGINLTINEIKNICR